MRSARAAVRSTTLEARLALTPTSTSPPPGVDRLQHDGAALGGDETRVKGAKYSGTGIA